MLVRRCWIDPSRLGPFSVRTTSVPLPRWLQVTRRASTPASVCTERPPVNVTSHDKGRPPLRSRTGHACPDAEASRQRPARKAVAYSRSVVFASSTSSPPSWSLATATRCSPHLITVLRQEMRLGPGALSWHNAPAGDAHPVSRSQARDLDTRPRCSIHACILRSILVQQLAARSPTVRVCTPMAETTADR